jgi:hypothetical protein
VRVQEQVLGQVQVRVVTLVYRHLVRVRVLAYRRLARARVQAMAMALTYRYLGRAQPPGWQCRCRRRR